MANLGHFVFYRSETRGLKVFSSLGVHNRTTAGLIIRAPLRISTESGISLCISVPVENTGDC